MTASPATEHLAVLAIGLPKRAGVTEARVDHPLAALATLPGTTVAWGEGSVVIPRDCPPGVLLLHRQFLDGGPLRASVEGMIAQGWVVVSDIDDDPRHWRGYVDSDFIAFRGVHAVSVSTAALAASIHPLNPNVNVFPNALPALPAVAAATPKQGRMRIFFGALNRSGDWEPLMGAIREAAACLAERSEFIVVHDEAFFARLPTGTAKRFFPTLSYADYMNVLAGCDLALLPLADTPFNRLKSDLKFLECCGAGAVPICSPTVYSVAPQHRAIGVFPATPDAWRDALLRLCGQPEEVGRRRAMGLEYVRSQRMHHLQAPLRAAWYRELLRRRARLERERRERLAAMAPR